MSTEKNIQTVKDFFAAIGRGDREGLLALVAEDIEWIIPGESGRWPERTADTQGWRICLRRHPSR
jgi:ketosteroid isomerase-like protein